MKNLDSPRFILALLVLITGTAIGGGNAHAFGSSRPTPPDNYCLVASPSPGPSPGVMYEINPATLRTRLTQSNLDIAQSALTVHTARNQVSVDKANLLPKLNINAAVQIVTGNYLSVVADFLLPFLTPSNWTTLAQDENQLNADKVAYLIMELNTYATAYATYETVLNDEELVDALQQDLAAWQQLADITDELSSLNEVPPESADTAHGQVLLEQFQVETAQNQLQKDEAELKQALSLDISQPIALDASPQYAMVAASNEEGTPPDAAWNVANERAPELEQVAYLLGAASDGKAGAILGFITGSTLSIGNSGGTSTSGTGSTTGKTTGTTTGKTTGSGSGSGSSTGNSLPNFGDVSLGASFTLGFQEIPEIQLSNRAVESLEIQAAQDKQQLGNTVETAFAQLPTLIQQYQTAQQAENDLMAAYEADLSTYTLGTGDIQTVLTARTGIQEAQADRLNAELNLNLARINLHRIFLTDQFQYIQGCGH